MNAMSKKKQIKESSLKDSGVFFGDEDRDNKRLYLFPCICGGNDHSLSVFYWFCDFETDLNDWTLTISRNLEKTWFKRRVRKATEYVFRKNVAIGMGSGTSLSMLSFEHLIDVLEGYVQFMKDNFSEQEMSTITPGSIRIHKIVQESPRTTTLILESGDDSAYLTYPVREKRYFLSIGMEVFPGFHLFPFEVSWTLPLNVSFLRRLYFAFGYVFQNKSKCNSGELHLRYPEVIMLIDHLKQLVEETKIEFAKLENK